MYICTHQNRKNIMSKQPTVQENQGNEALPHVMPRLIFDDLAIESPDHDGDFELTIYYRDGDEITRFFNKEHAAKIISFLQSHINET